MAVTEKGITPYNDKQGIPITLFTWLQRLHLLFPKINTYSATINPGNISANSELTETYTVTGLNTNDIVIVAPPSLDSGIGIMYCRVSAADTLQIRWRNFTGGGINPASGTYLIAAIRL